MSGLLLPLEVCLLGGEACSPDASVVEEVHLLSALCLFPVESDRCQGHLQKLTTQAWLPYTKLMEGMTEKVYKIVIRYNLNCHEGMLSIVVNASAKQHAYVSRISFF